MMTKIPILFALVVLAGCACDDHGVIPFEVSVRDATTGAPAAVGATLVVFDQTGARVDSVTLDSPDPNRPNGDLVLFGGRSSPGVYDLVVRKPGYENWEKVDVQVAKTGTFCPTLETVRLDAALEPLSS